MWRKSHAKGISSYEAKLMKSAPTLSVRDLQMQVAAHVSNAVIRGDGIPAEILAEQIIDESSADFSRQFARTLMIAYYSRGIRTERAKRRRAKLPEQFAHLPLRVRLPDNTRVRLDRITYSQAREYYYSLGRKLDLKKASDVRRTEAKALMDTLYKPAKENRGITAGQVLRFDFGE